MSNPDSPIYVMEFQLRNVLKNGLVVSTVKLPFPHNGFFYETMVFHSEENFSELAMKRYVRQTEAINGHHHFVFRWSKRQPPL